MKHRNLLDRLASSLRRNEIGAVGIMVVVTIVAGLLQNPLDTVLTLNAPDGLAGDRWALWSGPLARYPDDIAAGILVALAAFRLRRVNLYHAIGIGVWFAAMIVGAAHAIIFDLEPTSNVVDLFRQVTLPALLIFAGTTLTVGERKLLLFTTFLIAALNSGYAALEKFGIRLIDPTVIAEQVGRRLHSSGLPGNYMGWWIDGTRIERVGGIFLAPPQTGIFMAFAAVAAFWFLKATVLRYAASIVFALVAIGTLSRASLVILAAGILIPLLIKLVGRALACVIGVVLGAGGFVYIASHGNSFTHVDGLMRGLYDGLVNPLGRGFGFVGNFAAKPEGQESLAGIGLSAGGWLAIIALLSLVVTYAVGFLRSRGEGWGSAASLGLVVCALVAESAGGLAGTAAVWIFAGAALAGVSRQSDHLRKPDPRNQSSVG